MEKRRGAACERKVAERGKENIQMNGSEVIAAWNGYEVIAAWYWHEVIVATWVWCFRHWCWRWGTPWSIRLTIYPFIAVLLN